MKLSDIRNNRIKSSNIKSYRHRSGMVPVDSLAKFDKARTALDFGLKSKPGDIRTIAKMVQAVKDTSDQYIDDLAVINHES